MSRARSVGLLSDVELSEPGCQVWEVLAEKLAEIFDNELDTMHDIDSAVEGVALHRKQGIVCSEIRPCDVRGAALIVLIL